MANGWVPFAYAVIKLTGPAKATPGEWESIAAEHKAEKWQTTCFGSSQQVQDFLSDFGAHCSMADVFRLHTALLKRSFADHAPADAEPAGEEGMLAS